MNNNSLEREFLIASKLSSSPSSKSRRAKLSDEVIEEVARKVLNQIKVPDEGTIILLDEGEKKEAPASKPKKEEPITMSDSSKEARIASRLVAIEFPTKKALEIYLKQHPDSDRSQHTVRESDAVRIMDDEGEERGPAKKEDDSKPSGKKEDEPDKGQKKEEPSEDAKLKGQLEKAVGKENVGNWKTHSLHLSQLTEHTKIQFPDGTSKAYKDLNDVEKARVQKAIASKKVGHKGMNDYTKVDTDTLTHNMKNNLGKYDSGEEESKNTSTEPITKESVGKFAGSMRKNAKTVLDRYAGAMSDISRPMAEKHIEHMASSIEEGIKDGSLSGISEADLDEFCREEMKRMVHQEVETRRRSLGDHGIRHLVSNSDNTMTMLNELQASGMKVTGKDKLMGLSIQANHDMGYTVGDPSTGFGGNHKENSGTLAGQEAERYAKVFGKDSVGKMQEIIRTHDTPEIDWEKEPLQSAVRLSDNISLFGNDKVQDLFIRSPKAMEHVCKLKLAADIEPPEPKEPKKKEITNPDEYSKALEKYKTDLDEYHKPEVQEKVKRARKLQDSVKADLHKVVDSEDYNENDKELLHKQVDEMSSDFTSTDILSRYSGRIQGMNYDKSTKKMIVNMKYSPEGQIADMAFGDKVAGRQFSKFNKDMKATATGKKGQTEFGKPPSVELNIEGMDDNPEDTATTDAMKKFIKGTSRMTFNKAYRVETPDEALGILKESRDKFNEEEWDDVEKTFMAAKGDMVTIRHRLAGWPLLESEEAYISGKIASIGELHMNTNITKMIMASVATMSVYRRLAKLSDEEKQQVVDKVKEKMNLNETPDEAPAEDSEVPSEMAPVEEIKKDEQGTTEETPSEMAPIEEIKKDEQGMADDESPAENEEAISEKAPIEDEAKPALGDEFDDMEDEEDDDNEIEQEDEEVEEVGQGGKMESIVDDLVQEIKVIKEDGRITPSEVLGLITQMMDMVNLLVEAKAPTRRKKRASKVLREFIIAEKVASKME